MRGTDVHQHLWPEGFIAALARRRQAPRLVRDGRDWRLLAAGEAPSRLGAAAWELAPRSASLATDGIDRALVCLSSPLGIEGLPPDEARPLLAAWHDAVLGLEPMFGVWGAVALRDAGAAEVDTLLDRGAVGLSLPAGALAGPDRLERVGPLLEALERRDAPLLVHPGGLDHGPHASVPPSAWWPALTDYLASLQSAWLAFSTWGRPAHPRLRVVFVALAGLAPLHAERLTIRGGPRGAANDPLVFYDTSSYGHRAIDAMVRVMGVDALVHGSDRPVVDTVPPHGLGPAADHALKVANVARLLHSRAARLSEAA